MPPAKRSSTAAKSKPAAKKPSAQKTAAAGAKSTATTARKAAGRTSTQAKSGTTKTTRTAKAGAKTTARAAGTAVAETAKAARAGAKGTATAARGGAKQTASRAKAANTSTKRASGGDGVVTTAAKAAGRPRDTVMLTRERIQEALDDAASRGRVTRKDANDLVSELMKRGVSSGEDVRDEVGELIGKGAKRLGTASRKVRKAEPVDRLVRGADRARRAAGVGPSFPIVGYDDLNVSQVQARIKELSRPDQRKVLNYERKHADRKSVVGALEKSLG